MEPVPNPHFISLMKEIGTFCWGVCTGLVIAWMLVWRTIVNMIKKYEAQDAQ